MKRKLQTAAVILTVVLLSAFVILRANSYSLALRVAGFSKSASQEIYHGFSAENHREIRILATDAPDGQMPAVMCLTKNALGIWSVSHFDAAAETHPHWADITWVTDGGTVFQDGRVEKTGIICHYALCGDNARERICFEDGQLPDNAMVDFFQSVDGRYWVHVTYCLLPGTTEISFSAYQALVDNGCIAADE